MSWDAQSTPKLASMLTGMLRWLAWDVNEREHDLVVSILAHALHETKHWMLGLIANKARGKAECFITVDLKKVNILSS